MRTGSRGNAPGAGWRPQWVFWDNDGVLVDTERIYHEANRLVFNALGEPLDEERYRQLFLRDAHGLQMVMSARGLSAAESEAWREQRNAYYERGIRTADNLVLPDVDHVLDIVGRACRMAIVSSTLRGYLDAAHVRSGIPQRMEFILTAEDCPQPKPDPAPYRLALERAGIPPECGVAIEDSERGLRAARAAGLACIVVPHALTEHDRFDGAMAVLGSLREVPAVLGL
jgi:HAD superfamily hydrolase (TIGR01509 family)